MNNFFILILLSLLSTFVVGLAANVNVQSGALVSIDKYFKVILIGVFPLVYFYFKNQVAFKESTIKFFFPAFFIFFVYAVHFFFDNSFSPNMDAASKELVRLAGYSVMLLLAGTIYLRYSNIKFAVYLLCSMGFMLGMLSIQHSLFGDVEKASRYVGDLVRAGSELVDPNQLGALCVLLSLFGLVLFFTADKKILKIIALLVFVVSQIARMTTFSTGSLINDVVSIIVFVWLLGKINKSYYRQSLVLVVIVGGFGFAYIIYTGLFEILFYRLMLSDQVIVQSSVGSRLEQYEGYFSLVFDEPIGLITGFGAANLPNLIGTGFELHNSVLRTMAVGGILTFICYVYLIYLSFETYWKIIVNPKFDFAVRIFSSGLLASFIGWTVQSLTLPADTKVLQWFFVIAALMMRGYLPPNNKLYGEVFLKGK